MISNLNCIGCLSRDPRFCVQSAIASLGRNAECRWVTRFLARYLEEFAALIGPMHWHGHVPNCPGETRVDAHIARVESSKIGAWEDWPDWTPEERYQYVVWIRANETPLSEADRHPLIRLLQSRGKPEP